MVVYAIFVGPFFLTGRTLDLDILALMKYLPRLPFAQHRAICTGRSNLQRCALHQVPLPQLFARSRSGSRITPTQRSGTAIHRTTTLLRQVVWFYIALKLPTSSRCGRRWAQGGVQ